MKNIENKITTFLKRGAAADTFSGAQAAWYPRAGVLSAVCAGTTARTGGSHINRDTLFDIASVTKTFTAAVVLRMVDRGEMDLESRIDTYFPMLTNRKQGAATLAELLAHEAGFTSWLPLFESIPLSDRATPRARQRIIESALEDTGDQSSVGETVYTDLGFIVLAHLIETVTGQSLDALVAKEVTQPLGLESVHYRPVRIEPSSVKKTGVAATENCPWRGHVLIGEVHDDNAWSMGGVAGHAGLFATADDVARFGQAWLESLREGGWLSSDLASRAVCRRPGGRGLGWDLVSPAGSSAGNRFGARSFGHLGFSGCSLWVDPDSDLSVALNTNRVHFGRDNSAIRDFRPAFHNMLVDLLE
ncbi:MAG: beta-lactamase family protein [Deltaproteobacteria bacterium]|nr:beta-lactamase family protein [Deltaproteobacteria bacterium]